MDGGVKTDLYRIPKVMPSVKPSLAELKKQAKQEYSEGNASAEKPDFNAMLKKEMEELDM